MRQSTTERPQILLNRSLPYNGGTRPIQVASFRPALPVAMLAPSYNASTRNVKATTSCPRFSTRALATIQQSVNGCDAELRKTTEIATSGIIRPKFVFEFRSPWHAECITRLSFTQASPRWLFCEPRRRPTTYPFVILSKLSPRCGDHARHGILHVSHNQGE